MNDNKKTIEQTVDILIEGARKTSNTFMLETAKLIKAALVNNQHSEKPVSELEVLQKMAKEREKAIAIYDKAGRDDLALKETRELGYIQGMMPKEPSEQEIEKFITELMEETTLTIKDTRDVIVEVQNTFPTAQKSTIVKIFKSLLQ
nr:MAG TPA: YqeY-like protein [Bacteriophage sp.]